MALVIAFVHGWSVTSKDTYGQLPEAVAMAAAAAGVSVELKSIFLGRYISFHDEVTVDDIATALQYAVQNDLKGIQEFSCITHSTGAPVVRRWVDMFYGPKRLSECPLRHLIMLAPANHGSALAILGKERVGRIQAWLNGIEPGQGVLDWLCLGSREAWSLQDRFTDYTLEDSKFFPFVLSGETIDEKLYDFVNSYLGEIGSDGVVRLAAANLNYSFIHLEQTDQTYEPGIGDVYKLVVRARAKTRPPRTGFAVIPDASHSGTRLGIMRSITVENASSKAVVKEIVECLRVKDRASYDSRVDELDALTDATQRAFADARGKSVRRVVMFIFRVRDDRGEIVGNFDLLLLGDGFDPNRLPKGFFVDRQRNPRSQSITYYLDYDILTSAAELGVQINARPSYRSTEPEQSENFAGYRSAEFRFSGKQLAHLVRPNETVYVDILLKRVVDSETMRLDSLDGAPRGSFKRTTPAGPVS